MTADPNDVPVNTDDDNDTLEISVSGDPGPFTIIDEATLNVMHALATASDGTHSPVPLVSIDLDTTIGNDEEATVAAATITLHNFAYAAMRLASDLDEALTAMGLGTAQSDSAKRQLTEAAGWLRDAGTCLRSTGNKVDAQLRSDT